MIIALLTLAWGFAEAPIGSGAFTIPSDCSARTLLDFITTNPGTRVCTYLGSGDYTCRYWSRPYPVDCASYEAGAPAGVVLSRAEP